MSLVVSSSDGRGVSVDASGWAGTSVGGSLCCLLGAAVRSSSGLGVTVSASIPGTLISILPGAVSRVIGVVAPVVSLGIALVVAFTSS